MATASALDVASEYVAAMKARDFPRMDRLRADDFVLDFVHNDAAGGAPMSAEDTREFWPVWFAGFPGEYDYEVTRTIAAEDAVVTQWTFTGDNTGPVEPPIIVEEKLEPTGRTIRLRGVSVYDISDGLITRETLYIDYATLLVEFGRTDA